MTTEIDDGGSAFPIPDQRDAMGNGIVQGSDGMSLRDYFAAQALVAMGTWCPGSDVAVSMRPIKQAEHAYAVADAMLKARK